jgi:hypothetical protein
MRIISLAFLAILGGCMVGAPPRDVSADEPLPADLAAGDLVHRGPVTVVVPDPGMAVSAVAELDDGTAVELAIENPIDSAVRLAVQPAEPPVVEPYSATPNECTDGAYHLYGYHWTTNYAWSFDAGSTPTANNVTNVEAGLQYGANGITDQRNKCGLTDRVSATNTYEGRTTARPNLTATTTTITCGTPDGKNVVGFGLLPEHTLAITCAWYDGDNHATEADIRFNKTRAWFALSVPSGCSNRDGIEQVATHEFGHVFGLAHVSQSLHPELTMSPIASPCSNNKATLGLGDINGLRALY